MSKHYSIKGKEFTNKTEALVYATQNNLPANSVRLMFYDDVWKAFDRTKLGLDLKGLYKQRAQQIRDKYDYLILYYSGGADSHNILRTFLDNNIRLDEIAVRWPKKLIGSSLYVPNSLDQTARNFVSEWDLVISKELDKIRQFHPNIKITVLDFVENIPRGYYNDNIFSKQNHMHSAVNLLRMQKFTDIEINPKGKKVCAIAGIDKPLLVEHKGKAYMFFSDDIVSLHTKTEESYREDFYWTPDMPELAFNMAYTVFLYFKHNHMARPLLPKAYWTELEEVIKYDSMQYYYKLIKPIIYETWDLRKFQADKPFQGFKADKDFWFYESTDFEKSVEQWKYYYGSQLSAVDAKFCLVDKEGNKTGYKPIISNLYFVGSF